ncbi:WbuC family cupin fold metalloprotein [Shewanella sp.]|jgi:cupin fold WbuC family metalloprotein|uniref:WbuC family cupin fold metalloprotein n=1 Tax=Shewanella sp. TaxID=50422 RepID=UPI00404718D3
MIKIRKESDEVLYPEEDVVLLQLDHIQELKRRAELNLRHRVRLCAHRSPQDSLHEMFIVHMRDCYVRPHKHLGKVESMAVLEGEVDMVLFHDDGSIRRMIPMGTQSSGKVFYQRLADPVYHTLLIRSEFLVFHEITEGPFLRKSTVFPDWAPAETGVAADAFLDGLETQIRNSRGTPL